MLGRLEWNGIRITITTFIPLLSLVTFKMSGINSLLDMDIHPLLSKPILFYLLSKEFGHSDHSLISSSIAISVVFPFYF